MAGLLDGAKQLTVCGKMKIMKNSKGFTVVEVMVAVLVLVVLTVFFIIQRNGLEETTRDQERKMAINSMYYSLTEGFYKDNGYYPESISRDKLPTVDPTLFTDPSGYTLEGDSCVYTSDDNEQKADGKCEYHYAASDCDNEGKCKNFKLVADLEAEDSYTKSSQE